MGHEASLGADTERARAMLSSQIGGIFAMLGEHTYGRGTGVNII